MPLKDMVTHLVGSCRVARTNLLTTNSLVIYMYFEIDLSILYLWRDKLPHGLEIEHMQSVYR